MRVFISLFLILFPVNTSAGELLNSFLPHLKITMDWERISWYQQVKLADEIAAEIGLKNGNFLNACLDTAATDVRLQTIPFKTALLECAKLAKTKNK